MPSFGNSLEFLLTRVLEDETRARDQVFDGLGYEYFGGSGLGADASRDRDGDTGDVVVLERHLSRMQPCADLDAQRPHVLRDGPGTPNCASRSIERRQESITEGLYLPTPVSSDLFTDDRVMSLTCFLPYAITDAS